MSDLKTIEPTPARGAGGNAGRKQNHDRFSPRWIGLPVMMCLMHLFSAWDSSRVVSRTIYWYNLGKITLRPAEISFYLSQIVLTLLLAVVCALIAGMWTVKLYLVHLKSYHAHAIMFSLLGASGLTYVCTVPACVAMLVSRFFSQRACAGCDDFLIMPLWIAGINTGQVLMLGGMLYNEGRIEWLGWDVTTSTSELNAVKAEIRDEMRAQARLEEDKAPST